MLLENKYYKIQGKEENDTSTIFHIDILPECDVYQGHFPGKPVCPGVCNIQTIKECAMIITGKKLFLDSIKRCRLTAVATPQICPQVDLTISATPKDNGFEIEATIADAKQAYMDYKGYMTIL